MLLLESHNASLCKRQLRVSIKSNGPETATSSGLVISLMEHDANVMEQEFKESLDELRKIVANLDDTRWLNEDMPVTPDRLEASAGL